MWLLGRLSGSRPNIWSGLTGERLLLCKCKKEMADKQNKASQQERIEIRKYPNRRYYNPRDSKHVTLEKIRDLIREGHDVRVTDSKSGEDITAAVLTQILLEIESPKLSFFPTSLLQHLIRLNSSVLDSFTENYFHQAFAAFRQSPEQWGVGFMPNMMNPFGAGGTDWTRFWSEAFKQAPTETTTAGTSGAVPADSGSDGIAAMREELENLRRKIERMEGAGK